MPFGSFLLVILARLSTRLDQCECCPVCLGSTVGRIVPRTRMFRTAVALILRRPLSPDLKVIIVMWGIRILKTNRTIVCLKDQRMLYQ